MRHFKYSNNLVMAAIAAGYLILILADIFLHINIMYLLTPYVLLTLWIANYTKKRSLNFSKYYLGFELDLNSKGHVLKFFIFAHNTNQLKHYKIETVKYSQYQTTAMLDTDQLRNLLISLGYLVIIPKFVSKFNQLVVNRLQNESVDTSIGICTTYYDDILVEYNKFRSAVISSIKQNMQYLLDQREPQPFEIKLKNRRPFYLSK